MTTDTLSMGETESDHDALIRLKAEVVALRAWMKSIDARLWFITGTTLVAALGVLWKGH